MLELRHPRWRNGRGVPVRDTPLHRDVAIKVPPTDVSARPEAVARFELDKDSVVAQCSPTDRRRGRASNGEGGRERNRRSRTSAAIETLSWAESAHQFEMNLLLMWHAERH
jgi:hypothetical protein